ncbi:MAS20 protein import receptor domain-containing protein [Ditylenchus destructor]|nr:MAS20 protein import receptor domain-containing protein [Ditylenchus destructor]
MSSVLNLKSPLVAVAGAAGIGFIGYCIYFDRKRRSDPNYKQKIRQNRMAKLESQSVTSNTAFPDPRDQAAMQKFFFEEISLGEQLMNEGSVEEGVIHMANARQQNSVRGYMQSVSIIDVTNDAGDVGVEHRQPLGQLILDADDLE